MENTASLSNPVEAKDVGLGEQPNHPEPITIEEAKQVADNNKPLCLQHWKDILSFLNTIYDKVKDGKDTETVQIRSYVSVQRHHATIKIEKLGEK